MPELKNAPRPKLYFLSCGLGRCRRGYEAFTQECFDVLSKIDRFEIWLFKGAGSCGPKERNIPSLYRRSGFAKLLGMLIGRTPYFIEQATFACCILPYVILQKPDIIFISDGSLANILWHARRVLGLQYKILFSNGGPLDNDLHRWDHIQQVAPTHLAKAISNGIATDKQTLLPYALKTEAAFNPLSQAKKAELRAILSLPTDRKILLSCGAINKHHKRMDYLIKEVASLPAPRPFLLILGQWGDETEEVKSMAYSLLGKENVSCRTLPSDQVNQFFDVCDIFILASVSEGLARVLLEACSSGMPSIVHDYEVPRFVFDNQEYFIDMTKPGELTSMLTRLLTGGDTVRTPQARHADIYARFSWDRLVPKYLQMFDKCLTS